MNTPTNIIVPTDVLAAHLKSYNKDQRAELNTVLQSEIKKITDVFNYHAKPGDERIAKLFIGGPGTGKTTYMKKQMQEEVSKGKLLAKLDFDDIIMNIPSVSERLNDVAQLQASDSYTNSHAFDKMMDNTMTPWINGTRWIRDSLVNHIALKGTPFAEETSGSNPKIEDILTNLVGHKYLLDINLFSAPHAVQHTSTQKHTREDLGVPVSEDTITQLTKGSIDNSGAFARHADRLTFIWRENTTATATPVAVSDITGIQILDPAGCKAFDAEHKLYNGPGLFDMFSIHKTELQKKQNTRMFSIA